MSGADTQLSEPGIGGKVCATVDLLLTTNPGLEGIVDDELCSHLDAAGLHRPAVERRPRGFHGQVLARVPGVSESRLLDLVMQMRSIHHVMQPLYGFDIPSPAAGCEPEALDVIYRILRDREVRALEEAATFRVTTKRNGVHSFSSMDVQRHAGAALVDRYGCGVDLTDFDVNVRVDVFGELCSVGVQRTRHPLSRRHARVYNPRAALKANVAFALLQMARIGKRQPAAILDPFCGSGTILLEAAQLLPHTEIRGSDYSERAVAGCRDNIEAERLSDRIDVRHCDARFMSDVYENSSFEALVTNPPFGIRLGRSMNYLTFYRAFFEQAAQVLKPGGRIVMMAWKRGLVDKANHFERAFRRIHAKVIETGGIYPRAYVFERR